MILVAFLPLRDRCPPQYLPTATASTEKVHIFSTPLGFFFMLAAWSGSACSGVLEEFRVHEFDERVRVLGTLCSVLRSVLGRSPAM